MSPKISIRHLNLNLALEQPILKDISLELPSTRITCLIGPSGSGKSTLLRCLNRLWEPPAGTIFLEDQDITHLNVQQLRRRVGMLFQAPALFEGTVASNVVYGPGLRGEALPDKRVIELLEMAGLAADLAAKQANELSVGQAQRVALARALANEPEVLLLDEPTSALDPQATRHVEETVVRLRDQLGLTVVWVSHSIEQVERVADELILLVHGQVMEVGAPTHLLSGAHHHLTEDFAAGKL